MSGNSQRTLSEYFANAGPSLFDELAAGQNSQMEKGYSYNWQKKRKNKERNHEMKET